MQQYSEGTSHTYVLIVHLILRSNKRTTEKKSSKYNRATYSTQPLALRSLFIILSFICTITISIIMSISIIALVFPGKSLDGRSAVFDMLDSGPCSALSRATWGHLLLRVTCTLRERNARLCLVFFWANRGPPPFFVGQLAVPCPVYAVVLTQLDSSIFFICVKSICDGHLLLDVHVQSITERMPASFCRSNIHYSSSQQGKRCNLDLTRRLAIGGALVTFAD